MERQLWISRLEGLLEKLTLTNRIITDESIIEMNETIDYTLPVKYLEVEKKKSLEFLENILDGS